MTNLGIMRFDETTKIMYLSEYYSFTTPEEVAASTGFDLDISRARQAAEPTGQELDVLRTQVDPQRLILGPLPRDLI